MTASPLPEYRPMLVSETMHQAARTDSDRVAAITVARRPPMMQHHDPTPPCPALGSSPVCLASSHHRQNGSFLDLCADHSLDFDTAASLGRHNTNINILISDPVLSSSSHQPSQRRLGFFSSNTATHSKTSPSPHLDPKAQSHSHSRSDITARKVILLPNMTSAASSSAVSKVHTSPSKVGSGGVNTLTVVPSRPLTTTPSPRREPTTPS